MPTPTVAGLQAELESLERLRDEAEAAGDYDLARTYEYKIERVKIELHNLGH